MATSCKKRKLSTSFDTDWDIDAYKTEYESEEHWRLRRRFMEVHKCKFSEERLVCLAQVFTNVEFMGCKYPDETMKLVGELSQEVAKEFRAQRANKLKRTFVKASEAAEARAKGHRTQIPEQTQQQTQPNNKARKFFGTGEWSNEKEAKRYVGTQNIFEGLPYGRFVLNLVGGRNCIRLSAQRAKMEYEERELGAPHERKAYEIQLNRKIIASALEDNLKLAKSAAFTKALKLIQQSCYSIKINPARDNIMIDKSDNKVVCEVTKQQSDSSEEKRLDSSNKGFKMMKMMGWTGGGLGSKTQGREDPVGYLLKNNRAGLGNNACKLDRAYFSQMLKNYLDSDDIRDLQFEPTFTKDERAMLHELAGKLNLKSSSKGKGDARSLVISKKTITDERILTEVLINKKHMYCDKFLVQVPISKAKDYPEYTKHLELDM